MTLTMTLGMANGMTLGMKLGMTLGMTYFYLHFWHMYLPSAVALTLSLHSWHKARPKIKKTYFKNIKIIQNIIQNIYFFTLVFDET